MCRWVRGAVRRGGWQLALVAVSDGDGGRWRGLRGGWQVGRRADFPKRQDERDPNLESLSPEHMPPDILK